MEPARGAEGSNVSGTMNPTNIAIISAPHPPSAFLQQPALPASNFPPPYTHSSQPGPNLLSGGPGAPPPYPGLPAQNPYYQNLGFVSDFQFVPPNPNFGTVHETVAVAQAVNAAIHQNGRAPVSVVCPNCNGLTTTEITEVPNSIIAQGQSRPITMFFAGTVIVVIGIFGMITFVSGTYLPLMVLPGFIFILLLGYLLMRWARRNNAKLCCDVQHRCSHCKVLLGVNSGFQMYQQLSMAAALRQRRR